MIPTELLGTIPGWITAGGVATILGIVVKWHLGAKKIAVEAEQVHVNARVAENADDADVRDHYAQEVERLTRRLDEQSAQFRQDLHDLDDRWSALLRESETRHEECQRDRDTLRERVRELEDDVRGLIRIITQASADKVISLGPDVSPHIREAAARVGTKTRTRTRQ